MPLYDYDCAACGRRVEVVHGVHAPGPTHCPSCGSGPLRKAITAPAVHFKGSGWAKKERHAAVASGTRTAGESAAADSDAKDAGATTTPAKTETTDGDAPATDRPAAKPKIANAANATKSD